MFKEAKCTLLRCCTYGTTFESNYTINYKELIVKDVHRDLGVLISSNLLFNEHYLHIVSRSYRILWLL